MFAALSARGQRLAEARAAARRARLAARIGGTVEGETVILEGRGIVRRHARDAALRWRLAEAIDER